MALAQICSGARRHATSARRIATTGRRGILFLGAIGMVAAAAVMTAGPALADVGSEPGNLKFSPASGATTLQPTWSTTDGCPVGYQGSAEVSIFDASGVLLSRISTVAYNVIHPFGG